MRVPSILALAATVVFGATIASSALAENEYDVAVSGGSITVTAKGTWHINKEFPWKVKQAGKTVDAAKVNLQEKTATVSGVPKGTVTLKGAVCNGAPGHEACMPFSKDVTVQ